MGLLYCLSTAADRHSHVAEQGTRLSVSPMRSDLRPDSCRGSDPTQPSSVAARMPWLPEDAREILVIPVPLQPSECHSSILHEVGGEARTPRPESSGPAEDSGRGRGGSPRSTVGYRLQERSGVSTHQHVMRRCHHWRCPYLTLRDSWH